MSENKTGKYFKYAIGEIVLVVIGILIALSINNWNERRKSKIMAHEVYTNLLSSLEQDSLQVEQTIVYISKSLEAQNKLIFSTSGQNTTAFNQNDLDKMVRGIAQGVMSFFPKTGVYDLLTSNNSMDLLQSKKIKLLLINLYDFQYKRYENIDAIIDNKYHYQLRPLLHKKMEYVELFNDDFQPEVVRSIDPMLFNQHYEELVGDCQDIYTLLSGSEKQLFMIRESINELIPLIRKELEN